MRNKDKYIKLLQFLLLSVIIAAAGLPYINSTPYLIQASFSISFVLTITGTFFSIKLIRYIFLTVTALVLLFIFIINEVPHQLNYFSAGLMLGMIIAILSFKMKLLSAGGAAAATLLAGFIFGFGGWKWTTPILVFFLLSSFLSKVRSSRNREVDIHFEKTGTRDHLQVFSNGGLGAILVIINYFFQSEIYFILYAAAVASVCADTWGTEIGTMYRTRTYNILNFKEVEQGTSGAISLPGTAGSVAGALSIAFVSVLWISFNFIPYFLVIFFSGIAGSFIDSLTGAAFQGNYKCKVCGTQTERIVHCSEPAVLIKGYKHFNNDLVNFLAAVSGGIFSIIFLYIFL